MQQTLQYTLNVTNSHGGIEVFCLLEIRLDINTHKLPTMTQLHQYT
jgi:hypothetical protein